MPGSYSLEEAAEDAQGDVLPIGGSAGGCVKPALGQPGEPLEIPLPEQASGLTPVAGLEVIDLMGHGLPAVGRHERTPSVVA